jgi:hypothetical protein
MKSYRVQVIHSNGHYRRTFYFNSIYSETSEELQEELSRTFQATNLKDVTGYSLTQVVSLPFVSATLNLE